MVKCQCPLYTVHPTQYSGLLLKICFQNTLSIQRILHNIFENHSLVEVFCGMMDTWNKFGNVELPLLLLLSSLFLLIIFNPKKALNTTCNNYAMKLVVSMKVEADISRSLLMKNGFVTAVTFEVFFRKTRTA